MPNRKTPLDVRYQKVIDDIENHINEIQRLINQNISEKGLKSDECQKTALINSLHAFQHTVNGIEKADFIGSDVPNTGEATAFPEMLFHSMKTDNDPNASQHYLSFYTASGDVGSTNIVTVPDSFIEAFKDFVQDHIKHFGTIPMEFSMDLCDINYNFSKMVDRDSDEVVISEESLFKLSQILGII